ncbi:hypothetical protein WN48_10112 [Eufriesea mexicana]|nr:hypothetical protein WN48_10112 [Eufriesea mexicana]
MGSYHLFVVHFPPHKGERNESSGRRDREGTLGPEHRGRRGRNEGARENLGESDGGVASVANSVPPSPPASGRMQNTEGQAQQDGASALHRVLCAETFAEKERRLSEMILQLQLMREQLLQDQSKGGGVFQHHRCYCQLVVGILDVSVVLENTKGKERDVFRPGYLAGYLVEGYLAGPALDTIGKFVNCIYRKKRVYSNLLQLGIHLLARVRTTPSLPFRDECQ